MSAIGSCSASWKDTLLFSACRPGRSTSTKTTPALASRASALMTTAASCESMPSQNEAGTPMRRPAQRRGGGHRRAGDHRIEQRDVGHAARHRADGVAGVADRHHRVGVGVAPLRAAIAHRRTQPDDAAQRRRHARRAAGVGAQTGRHDARGDGRRGAARRTAGDARAVVGVLHRAGKRREIGAGDAEGQLVQVGLADDDGAGIEQLLQRRRIALRPHAAQCRGAAGGGQRRRC